MQKCDKRISKGDVKGLPDKASIQGRYVFFDYAFRRGGKPVHERDYLGVVSDDNEFIPNDYYKLYHPVKENRPIENWKDPDEKARHIKKLEQEKVESDPLDLPPRQEFAACVGITALAMRILYDSGIVEDVGNGVFGGNIADTMHAINIGMHAALTARATYLAKSEAEIQKFIGIGCLSSPRASEFHQRIGKSCDLSLRLNRARGARIQKDDILALDGTRINCDSQQIGSAAVGKDKNHTYSSQINYSLLVDAVSGLPIAYRYFAGNTADISTLDDFRSLWESIGVSDRETTMLLDRGYFGQPEMIKLINDKIRFVMGAKTSLTQINNIITEDNHQFGSALNLIGEERCYGLKREIKLVDGKSTAVSNAFVFRDPNAEMDASAKLRKELNEFARHFCSFADLNDPRLAFFHPYKRNEPLKLNEQYFEQYCYTLGFFAFISNRDISVSDALDLYSRRNEVECVFRLMLGNLMRTTRVHSTAALEGLLFTTFIGLSVIANLRQMLKRLDANGVPLSSTYTISELMKTLQRIMLVRDRYGKCRLLNVTKKDRQLVKDLGYEGLFDNADAIHNLLTARNLENFLKLHK